jgi:hypothetical protein
MAVVILCRSAALAIVTVWPSKNGDPGGQDSVVVPDLSDDD